MGTLSTVVDACRFLKVIIVLYRYKSHVFGACLCLTTTPTSCTIHPSEPIPYSCPCQCKRQHTTCDHAEDADVCTQPGRQSGRYQIFLSNWGSPRYYPSWGLQCLLRGSSGCRRRKTVGLSSTRLCGRIEARKPSQSGIWHND